MKHKELNRRAVSITVFSLFAVDCRVCYERDTLHRNSYEQTFDYKIFGIRVCLFFLTSVYRSIPFDIKSGSPSSLNNLAIHDSFNATTVYAGSSDCAGWWGALLIALLILVLLCLFPACSATGVALFSVGTGDDQHHVFIHDL